MAVLLLDKALIVSIGLLYVFLLLGDFGGAYSGKNVFAIDGSLDQDDNVAGADASKNVNRAVMCRIVGSRDWAQIMSPAMSELSKLPEISCCLMRRASFLLSVLDRKIHAHPSCRQSYSFFLIHAHTRIISLDQGHVCPLSSHVCEILLCLRNGIFAGAGGCLRVEVLAQALVQGRSCPGEDWPRWQLPQERPVKRSKLRGCGGRHRA